MQIYGQFVFLLCTGQSVYLQYIHVYSLYALCTVYVVYNLCMHIVCILYAYPIFTIISVFYFVHSVCHHRQVGKICSY